MQTPPAIKQSEPKVTPQTSEEELSQDELNQVSGGTEESGETEADAMKRAQVKEFFE